jgi:hypothetical protein
VDILIGQDTGPQGLVRSIDGPDANRIKDDIRNIIQLTVVDGSGRIVTFDEVHRRSDTETVGELRIASIPFGETCHFLLLMGHWKWDYRGGGSRRELCEHLQFIDPAGRRVKRTDDNRERKSYAYHVAYRGGRGIYIGNWKDHRAGGKRRKTHGGVPVSRKPGGNMDGKTGAYRKRVERLGPGREHGL